MLSSSFYFSSPILESLLQVASQITLSLLITQAFLQLVKCIFFLILSKIQFFPFLIPCMFPFTFNVKIANIFLTPLCNAFHLLETYATWSNLEEIPKMLHPFSALYHQLDQFFWIIFPFFQISSASYNSGN